MNEHEDTAEDGTEPSRWSRARNWARDHRTILTVVGLGVTAVALKQATGGKAVREWPAAPVTFPALADPTGEAAAQASSRVAAEFEALGYAYKSSAMDRTVRDAVRRHQRWTPEELEVLADPAKTALEKAVELRRTFNGVMAKSIQQGLSSKAP